MVTLSAFAVLPVSPAGDATSAIQLIKCFDKESQRRNKELEDVISGARTEEEEGAA